MTPWFRWFAWHPVWTTDRGYVWLRRDPTQPTHRPAQATRQLRPCKTIGGLRTGLPLQPAGYGVKPLQIVLRTSWRLVLAGLVLERS